MSLRNKIDDIINTAATDIGQDAGKIHPPSNDRGGIVAGIGQGEDFVRMFDYYEEIDEEKLGKAIDDERRAVMAHARAAAIVEAAGGQRIGALARRLKLSALPKADILAFVQALEDHK